MPAKKPQHILTTEELLSVDDRPEKLVEVPEWGGSVKIKALSLGQFQRIQEAAAANGDIDEQKAMIHWLIEGMIEPKVSTDQAELLRDKSISALSTVMTEIAELSATTAGDLKAAEARFPDSS